MKRIGLIILITLFSTIVLAPTPSERVNEDKKLKERVLEIVEKQNKKKQFQSWGRDLGYKESRNKWWIVNRIGCFGEHQWKESTLHSIGYMNITLRDFKTNPEIFPRSVQYDALETLADSNWVDFQYFQCFVGTYIDGVYITKSGLLAAAHLGGVKSVIEFLWTSADYILVDSIPIELVFKEERKKLNRKDLFGTSISDYLELFQGYDF